MPYLIKHTKTGMWVAKPGSERSYDERPEPGGRVPDQPGRARAGHAERQKGT